MHRPRKERAWRVMSRVVLGQYRLVRRWRSAGRSWAEVDDSREIRARMSARGVVRSAGSAMVDCDVTIFNAWTTMYTRYQEWPHERGEEEDKSDHR